jgi:hypothetical protein
MQGNPAPKPAGKPDLQKFQLAGGYCTAKFRKFNASAKRLQTKTRQKWLNHTNEPPRMFLLLKK